MTRSKGGGGCNKLRALACIGLHLVAPLHEICYVIGSVSSLHATWPWCAVIGAGERVTSRQRSTDPSSVQPPYC